MPRLRGDSVKYDETPTKARCAFAAEIVKICAFSDGVRDIVFDSCLADDRGDGTFFVKAEYSVTETVNF